MLNHKTGKYIYQSIEENKGITAERFYKLNLCDTEIYSNAEVERIGSLLGNETYGEFLKAMLYDNKSTCEIEGLESFINFINYKRAFFYEDEEGVVRALVIPRDRVVNAGELNNLNSKLLSVAMNILRWTAIKKGAIEGNEKEALERMQNSRHSLQLDIAKRLFSKRFKDKFQFKFIGLSGVALTSNGDINSIYLPQWYADKNGLKIGDVGIVTRDPIQNVFIVLKLAGYTKNELRISPYAMRIIDGDFDGDRIQFIPWKNIKSELEKHGATPTEVIKTQHELVDLYPTRLLESDIFKPLTEDYR